MKKLLTVIFLTAALVSHAQESFFRGNNNYQAPIIQLPTISATAVVSSITRYSAVSGGTIIDNGGAPILASGICWSATSNTPTISDNKTTDGSSIGSFSSSITGLTAGVTYNVRAYATNRVGTTYGAVQTFTTFIKTIQTAVLIGNKVWTDKNLNVANYRNGDPITFAANAAQWTALNNAREGAYMYLLYANANGGQTYGKLYNWYAVNDARGLAPEGYHIPTNAEWETLRSIDPTGYTFRSNTTDWGASFTNSNDNLIISNRISTPVGDNSTGFNVLPGGNLSPRGTNLNGGSGWFWNADAASETTANWTYFVTSTTFNGSTCCGAYDKGHAMSVRLVKDNNVIDIASSTPILAATLAATSLTPTSAVVGGNVTDQGMTQVSTRGFVYGTSAGSSTYSLTTGAGAGTFTVTLSGLTTGTTYYVRSFATNEQGTTYGSEINFTPDFVITTVTIGSQIWTDRNLEVTKYRNGDPITYASNAAEWSAANAAGQGAYMYLLFANAEGGQTYGKLYNWYAVNDSRGLAPAGYHIPTQAEWTTLRGTQPGNGKTFKTNTTDWGASFSKSNNNLVITPDGSYFNYNGTNTTGFNCLPAGSAFPNGTNGNYGTASFWTATPDATDATKANWTYFHIGFLYDGAVCCGTYEKGNGMSVRLVKD